MTVELPKDAEGSEIPLDTKVLYDECGNEYEVSRYCCSVRQSIPERVWDAVMLNTLTYYTSRLYLTPPDSWEKLEEDLDRGADAFDYETCAYFGNSRYGCSSCIANESRSCEKVLMRDIASRIRKLRGDGDA